MTTTTRIAGPAALTGYAGTIVAANYLTSRYGMVHVAPGLMVTAGTFAAGAALLMRDAVQDTLGRWWVLAGIATGGALTWATSPTLAAASTAAFLFAELADMAVYTPLRSRGWARAVFASNTVGAIVDTLLFLWLAGFPITAAAVSGQLVGKLAWATALPVLAVLTIRQVRRAVPRHSLGT
ncbi:VUT family protein [Streptomyces sp. NPDC051992]|uniref:VUT family protein n=1 Tax=Streptomyces sp. NPDC051992 TaxID=3161012 RepID=UPI0034490071